MRETGPASPVAYMPVPTTLKGDARHTHTMILYVDYTAVCAQHREREGSIALYI